MHLQLHGCKCSPLKANSQNWKSPKASTRKNWFIYYRFYNPAAEGEYPKGKLIVNKGMNSCKTLEARQEATSLLIKMEMDQLNSPCWKERKNNLPLSGRHNQWMP